MDELFREEEVNRVLRERAGISEEIRDSVSDTSNAILDTVKELKTQIIQKSEIRSLTREINKIARDNYALGISDLGTQRTLLKLQRDQAAINAKVVQNNKLQDQIRQRIPYLQGEEKKAAVDLLDSMVAQTGEMATLKKELEEVETLSRKIQDNFVSTRLKGVAALLKSIPGLGSFAKPFQEASDNITKAAVAAERENIELKNIGQNQKLLNNDYLEYLDSKYKDLKISEILGLNEEESEKQGKKIFKINKEAAFEKLREVGILDKIIKRNKTNNVIQNESLKVVQKIARSLLVADAVAGFVALNKQQTEFRREIGKSANVLNQFNDRFILATDQVETLNALTQQFGFNAQSAFDQINVTSAAELVKLTGLSAEQAGRFARFSQASGSNLEDNLDTIITQVGQINIANKSAVTQRQIFKDIGDTTSAIGLTFQGNTVELARAAQQARILGLTLTQIDNIAAGLLDIESSIRSEFEAEVITGQQLNLERARFFALTNDLNGLTEELAANQEIINKFATGNRIEQEAIASALNMSRDEMADMIFQQRLQLGITDEQARLTAGLTQKDFERLTLQESITTSLSKIADTVLPGVEAILGSIANSSAFLLTTLGLVASLSFVRTIAQLATAAKLSGLLSANAITTASALTLGAGLIAIVAAMSYLGIKAAQNRDELTQVGDAFIPAGKGPIISTREGGLMQGTANDDIIMAPGIANIINAQRDRGERNTGNVVISDQQLERITTAVSRAQLNINGKRASSLLQPDFAVTTYSYSV